MSQPTRTDQAFPVPTAGGTASCETCRRQTVVEMERERLGLVAEVVAREKEISAMMGYMLWMADRIHFLETRDETIHSSVAG